MDETASNAAERERLRRWRKLPARLVRRSGRALRKGGRFAREERGASAVEFAIMGPVFLFTVFAILESASIYWVDRVLQSYASDLARSYRTGYVGTVTERDPITGDETVRDVDFCRDGIANYFFNCNNMMIDVRETSKVVKLRKADGTLDASQMAIDPGDSGTVNILRVYYNWERLIGVPFTPAGDARPDGAVELYAASGFVTE